MSTPLKEELFALARRQGFVAMGVAEARPDPAAWEIAISRIREGSFDGLPWFHEERMARATDPSASLDGARSLLLLAASYRHDRRAPGDTRLRGRISRYAWGRDYHSVIEKRARPLLRLLEERMPGSRSRLMVDHGPLMERAYARAAGLGWQGKNTLILSRTAGSYTFLGAIITTVELPADEPVDQTCGACTRCLPACPTGALRSEYEVVNDLCIAHHTIENRGPIPRNLRPLLGDWVFGCDLCQDACPVNETRGTPGMPDLAPRSDDDAWPDLIEALSLDEEAFRRRFSGRAVMRARYAGFLRNVCVALGNLADTRAVPALTRALESPEALVRGHAAWALGRLGAADALRARRPCEADEWVREEIDAALDAAVPA